MDPCSNTESSVGALTTYQLPTDGLNESWDFPTIYVNPPYGYDRARGTRIGTWVRRCSVAHVEHGSEIISLIPTATNTAYWQDLVFKYTHAVCFIREPRVKFYVKRGEKTKGAPMACSFLYWGTRVEAFCSAFGGHFGTCFPTEGAAFERASLFDTLLDLIEDE